MPKKSLGTALAADLAIENHFFHLSQLTTSVCRAKFKQASNGRVLEVAKLAYANKKRVTSEKLSSCHFWQIANSVLNKVKSAIPFSGSKVFSSASDKNRFLESCLLKCFQGTFILMTWVSLYLLSHLKQI